MRNPLAIVLAGLLVTAVPLAFAATGDEDTTPMAAPATEAPSEETTTALPAAPATPITPVAGSSLGEYKTVSCSSNSAFTINSCDQCFDGGTVKVGERLTGLFDNWSNSSAATLSAYKEEQKTPNMVRFGASTWTTTPASEAAVWKYSSDIVWVVPPGETKNQFLLAPGQKVKFLEAELGAGYTLQSTDKKAGEMVGLLRFPTVYHTLDLATATEGAATTHYECVSYKLDAPAPVAPAATGGTKAPEPTAPVTQTETGPETLLLIAAAFFIAFGMMFTLRRRI